VRNPHPEQPLQKNRVPNIQHCSHALAVTTIGLQRTFS
jgi:hypothetical protein